MSSEDPDTQWKPSMIDKGEDPYKKCEENCTHDTVPGCYTEEIIGPHDGPHPDSITERMMAFYQARGRHRP
jgi:hypothetical protein